MQKEETQNQKERNKMKKTILAVLATGFSCALLVTQQAKAVPTTISGELDLGGSVSYDSTSLASAKEVKTWYNVFGTAGLSSVTGATGDFSGIALGSDATMTAPWVFGSGQPALWSVGGFTFDLLTSAIVSQSSTFLNITGTGTISGNGFLNTQGVWSFTSTSANGGTSVKFGFTASTVAPDGGSAVALLGIALAGIEGVRRMFRARKA